MKKGMSLLPSLARLNLNTDAFKRPFDDVYHADDDNESGEDDEEDVDDDDSDDDSDDEVDNDVVTYVFKYADNCEIKFRTEVSESSIYMEMVDGGAFDVSISREFVNNNGVFKAETSTVWRKVEGCKETIPRAIRAVHYIVQLRFPEIKSLEYENSAVVDDWDLRDYKKYRENEGLSRRAAIQSTIAKMYWRVKYYESIGFEFEREYSNIVNEAVNYLNDQPRGRLDATAKREVDFDDERFSGDLIEIARALDNEDFDVTETIG